MQVCNRKHSRGGALRNAPAATSIQPVLIAWRSYDLTSCQSAGAVRQRRQTATDPTRKPWRRRSPPPYSLAVTATAVQAVTDAAPNRHADDYANAHDYPDARFLSRDHYRLDICSRAAI